MAQQSWVRCHKHLCVSFHVEAPNESHLANISKALFAFMVCLSHFVVYLMCFFHQDTAESLIWHHPSSVAGALPALCVVGASPPVDPQVNNDEIITVNMACCCFKATTVRRSWKMVMMNTNQAESSQVNRLSVRQHPPYAWVWELLPEVQPPKPKTSVNLSLLEHWN